MTDGYADGLVGFYQRYTEDHIVEYTLEESALLHRFDQCINCGLCLQECVTLRNLVSSDIEFAGPRHIGISLSRNLAEYWTTSDTIYYCTLCGACEAVCPSQIPIPAVVEMIRSKIPRQVIELVPAAHRGLAENLEKTGNIYGASLDYPKHHDENPEFVYFTGCVGSYIEKESAERTISTLIKLGVKFTTIEEVCCGGPTVVGGMPMVEALIDQNLEKILATGTNKVITECPRCYITFTKNPRYAEKLDVMHTLQFLAKFPWQCATQDVVVYHDPCEMGRVFGEYEAPRQILSQVAPNTKEMARTRQSTVCCGAGGGVRGVSPRLSLEMAHNRIKEALDSGANVLVTECSSCLHNFRNAVRSKDAIEVYNLSEYLGLLSGIENQE
jgi:Fe-S oxidoreductase